MHRVNLVFEGGGVKGIAHVGALHALETTPALKNVQIMGLGGTSAGAIVAALYAAGYTAQELKDELTRTPLSSLIGERVGYAKSAYRIWSGKGIYPTTPIYGWLRELLKKKNISKLGDFAKEGRRVPCRIVASDVTGASYEKYSEANPGEDAASVVLRSLSIPFFFRPYADGQRLYVDGGLLSNYPIWLFGDSEFPTVGVRFRHKEENGATPDSDVLAFLRSLVNTMLTAHDKLRSSELPRLNAIEIDADFVKSTDFHLRTDQEEMLFQRGKDATVSFDWDRVPMPLGVRFKDANANLILEETSDAINKIVLSTPLKGKRCYEKYEETWTCLENGDGVTEAHFRLRNVGDYPTTLIRYDITYDEPTPISFRDLEFKDLTVQPSGSVVVLPLQNTNQKKQFALWFLPPISPNDFRDVSITIYIPKYFGLLTKHQPCPISWYVDHESTISSAKFVLRVARELGDSVQVRNENSPSGTVRSTSRLSPDGNYHEVTWTLPDGLSSKPELSTHITMR